MPFVPCAVFLACALMARAVMPYDSATVTRVENKVSYGKVHGGQSQTRPANPLDVVKSDDFLLSSEDSRAELKYEDGTIIRIGQNTVFSFDAKSRTLKLDKGTLVFYIPKGQGGATIKTPSITAAITGTVGKVSENTIAIVEGEVVINPEGKKVGTFQFARRNGDGSLTIGFYDPAKARDGKLMTFNGIIPGLPEIAVGETYTLPPAPTDDVLSTTQNLPHRVGELHPPPMDKKKTKVTPPPPPPKDESKPAPY